MYVADGEKVICNLFFNGKDDFFVARVKGTKSQKCIFLLKDCNSDDQESILKIKITPQRAKFGLNYMKVLNLNFDSPCAC